MTTYSPDGPYVFKTGKRKGQSVEKLMFTDYSFLRWLYKRITEEEADNPNKLQKHLEWIFEQGEKKSPKIICPQCGERYVKYFSVRRSSNGDISVGLSHTSCEDTVCLRVLVSGANAPTQVNEFKFSTLDHIRKKDKKEIIRLFQSAFDVSRLERKKLFIFFSK